VNNSYVVVIIPLRISLFSLLSQKIKELSLPLFMEKRVLNLNAYDRAHVRGHDRDHGRDLHACAESNLLQTLPVHVCDLHRVNVNDLHLRAHVHGHEHVLHVNEFLLSFLIFFQSYRMM
jgi:hypothetical protein